MTRAKLESAISRDVKEELQSLGWHVEVITCNAFMRGIPDFYCFKVIGGEEYHRWVDIKRPKGGTLTKYQARKWPLFESIDLGVWILTGTGQEEVLFGPPNFRDWWRPRYDKYVMKQPCDLLREEFHD